MKKLRRSLSLRSSQRRIPESCRPQVWENDSYKVRNGGVNFPVKYVGCIEVTESRGTQVCAEAFRRLKETSSAKKKRMTLLVTADCIRLVDDETKSLVVDQTIEKVSFCTPDPSNDRVFSYICREGTTRRWMCHCFLAVRDTGERLSHAVGCAFTACLQRKQKAQALQQQHQAQKQKESEVAAGKPLTDTPAAPVVNGSSTTTTQAPTQPLTQAQLAVQARSAVPVQPAVAANTPSSPVALNSPAVPASPGLAPSPQQPVISSANQIGIPTTQPVLKPPPSAARPRPQAFNPSPFTRHMSLRYRSNPLSFTPLKEGGGYETLTEETVAPVPQLPPTVDALIQSSGTTSTSTTFDPTPGPQRVPVQQPPQAFNAFGSSQPAQMANSTNQNMANSWQPFGMPLQPVAAQGNVWPSGGHQPLARKVSDAENWLATVQADTKAVPNGTGGNQGLLTTTNPFSDTAMQLDALSSAWTKDLAKQLPNASVKPDVAAAGSTVQTSPWPSQPSQGDDFSSLASRHTSSPPAANPFGQNKQVFWVAIPFRNAQSKPKEATAELKKVSIKL